MGNRELADATGIPKATVSRLTATLVGAGYLRQSQDSERFSLGPALLDMSSRYLRHFDLRTVARPHLAALSDFAGASVHMGVRDELDMLIIDSLRPRSVMISLAHRGRLARMDDRHFGRRTGLPASLAAPEQEGRARCWRRSGRKAARTAAHRAGADRQHRGGTRAWATAARSANGIRISTRWASRCAVRAASATR